jgi:hypothetical protein
MIKNIHRSPITTATQPDAEQLLRDVAFALRLARQAAREIRDERARVRPATSLKECRTPCAAV